jgi:hypothetical protein
LLEQLSQPPPKRFSSMGSMSPHGPFGRLNRSLVPEMQNGQPNAPAVHNLVTNDPPDASGATSTIQSSTESNHEPESFTFGAQNSSAAPIEGAVGTTEARPALASETGAAESAVQALSQNVAVPGPSETVEAKPGFSFGTLGNAPPPSESAAPATTKAATAPSFSFGAQPTTDSLSTLENAVPANQTATTTKPTVTFGDSSFTTDNAPNLFSGNQGGFATNFGSTNGVQQHSGSGTESTSATPVIQFGAPSNAAPTPTLTIAAPAVVAPAFVFGSTSATTPPPGPVAAASAPVMGSFGTTPQFGMVAPPPPPPPPSVAAIAVPQFGANAVPQFGANAMPQFGSNAASAATGPMVFGANAAAPSTRPPPRRRNALRTRRT